MTLTRRNALLAIATVGGGWALPRRARGEAAACTDGALDAALDSVSRARANVNTLSGPFVQERTIGLLAAKVRSQGVMTLVRPDRLRWELLPPDDVVYWVTPDGLAYKSPTGQGKVPAGGSKIAAALDDLRILLGGDLGSLRGRYTLTGTCQGKAPVEFRAVPKPGSSASFQEIRFTLAPDLVSPASATIVEGPRDRTEIHFGAVRANAPVSTSAMVPGGR